MRGKQVQITNLIKSCVNLVKSYTPKEPLKKQCMDHQIITHLNSLVFQEFRLSQHYQDKGIGIRNIFECKQLRLTIYYLGAGSVMQTHDHPNMSVVSYILKGQMQAKLYSNIESNRYRKEEEILQPKDTLFIDGMRERTHNLHQFVALKPTFFLDIIFPDYDYKERVCKHYRQQQTNQIDEVILKQIEDLNIDFFQI